MVFVKNLVDLYRVESLWHTIINQLKSRRRIK